MRKILTAIVVIPTVCLMVAWIWFKTVGHREEWILESANEIPMAGRLFTDCPTDSVYAVRILTDYDPLYVIAGKCAEKDFLELGYSLTQSRQDVFTVGALSLIHI